MLLSCSTHWGLGGSVTPCILSHYSHAYSHTTPTLPHTTQRYLLVHPHKVPTTFCISRCHTLSQRSTKHISPSHCLTLSPIILCCLQPRRPASHHIVWPRDNLTVPHCSPRSSTPQTTTSSHPTPPHTIVIHTPQIAWPRPPHTFSQNPSKLHTTPGISHSSHTVSLYSYTASQNPRPPSHNPHSPSHDYHTISHSVPPTSQYPTSAAPSPHTGTTPTAPSPRGYDILLDAHSLHEVYIARGKTLDTTPEFASYRRAYENVWGSICALLVYLETLLT